MKLYITIGLVSILITTALALKCYQCKLTSNSSEECKQNQTKCPLQCGSVTIYNYASTLNRSEQGCMDSALCVTDDFYYGQNKTSFNPQCCDTELCNIEEAPALLRYINGLICYSCDVFGNDCSKIVTCTGDQNMCFTIAGMKGCADDSMCGMGMLNSLGSLNDSGMECCEGILCNQGQGVRQGFLLLLVPLLCLIFL